MVCKACTTHGKDFDTIREFVKFGFGGGKTSGVRITEEEKLVNKTFKEEDKTVVSMSSEHI